MVKYYDINNKYRPDNKGYCKNNVAKANKVLLQNHKRDKAHAKVRPLNHQRKGFAQTFHKELIQKRDELRKMIEASEAKEMYSQHAERVRKDHPHPKCAEDRNGFTWAVRQCCLKLGYEPREISPSSRSSPALPSEREHYSIADGAYKEHWDPMNQNTVNFSCDSSYYFSQNKLNDLSRCNALIFYEQVPTDPTGLYYGESLATCERGSDGDVIMTSNVNQGGPYRSKLWDWSRNIQLINRERKPMWSFLPFYWRQANMKWHRGHHKHSQIAVFVETLEWSETHRIVFVIPYGVYSPSSRFKEFGIMGQYKPDSYYRRFRRLIGLPKTRKLEANKIRRRTMKPPVIEKVPRFVYEESFCNNIYYDLKLELERAERLACTKTCMIGRIMHRKDCVLYHQRTSKATKDHNKIKGLKQCKDAGCKSSDRHSLTCHVEIAKNKAHSKKNENVHMVSIAEYNKTNKIKILKSDHDGLVSWYLERQAANPTGKHLPMYPHDIKSYLQSRSTVSRELDPSSLVTMMAYLNNIDASTTQPPIVHSKGAGLSQPKRRPYNYTFGKHEDYPIKLQGASVANAALSIPSVYPADTKGNEEQSIRARLTDVVKERDERIAWMRPGNKEFDANRRRWLYDEMALFSKLMLDGQVGTGQPISLEELVNVQRAPLQKKRNKFLDRCITQVHDLFKTKGFNKSEATRELGKDPRIISAPDKNWNAPLGTIMYGFTRDVCKIKNFWTSGNNGKVVANKVKDFSGKTDVLDCTDISRLDASVSLEMKQDLIEAIVLQWLAPEYKENARRCFKMEHEATVFCKHGSKARSSGNVLSGSAATTWAGSCINAFGAYLSQRYWSDRTPERCFDMIGLVQGDDGVSDGSYCTEDEKIQAYALIGLKVKFVHRAHKYAEEGYSTSIDFLSRHYPDPWNSVNSYTDIDRAISKVHILTTVRDNPLAWLYIKLESILHNDAETPVLSEWCHAAKRAIEKHHKDQYNKIGKVRKQEYLEYELKYNHDVPRYPQDEGYTPENGLEQLITAQRNTDMMVWSSYRDELNNYDGDIMNMPQLKLPGSIKDTVTKEQCLVVSPDGDQFYTSVAAKSEKPIKIEKSAQIKTKEGGINPAFDCSDDIASETNLPASEQLSESNSTLNNESSQSTKKSRRGPNKNGSTKRNRNGPTKLKPKREGKAQTPKQKFKPEEEVLVSKTDVNAENSVPSGKRKSKAPKRGTKPKEKTQQTGQHSNANGARTGKKSKNARKHNNSGGSEHVARSSEQTRITSAPASKPTRTPNPRKVKPVKKTGNSSQPLLKDGRPDDSKSRKSDERFQLVETGSRCDKPSDPGCSAPSRHTSSVEPSNSSN